MNRDSGGLLKQEAVYILASQRNGTLYIGVTSRLVQRVWQHRCREITGFTEKHHAHRLVYCELHDDISEALQREKRLKAWKRQWKIRLIEEFNPAWRDLYEDIL